MPSISRTALKELALKTPLVSRIVTLLRGSAWPPSPDKTLRFEYEYKPRVRFGYDRPPHQALAEVIGRNTEGYRTALKEIVQLQEYFFPIPVERPKDAGSTAPCWNNGWLPSMDAMSLYWLLAKLKPKHYLEVGSGNSTKFARRAITDHNLKTRIISIDPHPTAEIDDLCDRAIRSAFEDVELGELDFVGPGDVVFIDNSHRSFQGSDVTVFFVEFLPRLRAGTVVGIHDILLPMDYPDAWRGRFYNEQYLLACCLLYGDWFDTILPVHYACSQPELAPIVRDLFEDSPLSHVENRWGSAFWMRIRSH